MIIFKLKHHIIIVSGITGFRFRKAASFSHTVREDECDGVTHIIAVEVAVVVLSQVGSHYSPYLSGSTGALVRRHPLQITSATGSRLEECDLLGVLLGRDWANYTHMTIISPSWAKILFSCP